MPKDRKKQLANQQKHYQRHKEVYAARRKAQRMKRRAWANEYKQSPCTHCGERYPPPVMHLHAPYGHKAGKSVAQLIAACASEATIRSEAESCTLLCANCHIMLHIECGDHGLKVSTGIEPALPA